MPHLIDGGRRSVPAPDKLFGHPVINGADAHSNLTDWHEASDRNKSDKRQHSGEFGPQVPGQLGYEQERREH